MDMYKCLREEVGDGMEHVPPLSLRLSHANQQACMTHLRSSSWVCHVT